jgi:hypothetical protein
LDHTLAIEPKRAIRPQGKFTVVEGRDCKLRFLPYRDELLSIAYSQLAANRPHGAAGGLISYGIDYIDLFRRSPAYIDRILPMAKTDPYWTWDLRCTHVCV